MSEEAEKDSVEKGEKKRIISLYAMPNGDLAVETTPGMPPLAAIDLLAQAIRQVAPYAHEQMKQKPKSIVSSTIKAAKGCFGGNRLS